MDDAGLRLIAEMMRASLGVETHRLCPPFAAKSAFPLSRIFEADVDPRSLFSAQEVAALCEGTVYLWHTALGLELAFMRLPGSRGDLLVFGPFLPQEPTDAFFSSIIARNHIGRTDAAALRTFFMTVPVVFEPTLLAAAHAAAGYVFGPRAHIRVEHRAGSAAIKERRHPDAAFALSMELLEKRYRTENEIMDAVARGDDAAALRLGRALPLKQMTARAGSPLRGMKNMTIVMNTLLRKAVEEGGVHPVYIDQLSGAFAVKIERARDENELAALVAEMLRRYCALVRARAHAGHSLAVRRALDYIQLNLGGDLSLKSVAGALGFNPTYLSAQFSRELGETLTSHIHSQRLQTAARLLTETDLPVSEVAARVGMVDVSYFSRLFRKKYSLTPTQYRLGQSGAPQAGRAAPP